MHRPMVADLILQVIQGTAARIPQGDRRNAWLKRVIEILVLDRPWETEAENERFLLAVITHLLATTPSAALPNDVALPWKEPKV